MEIKCISQTKSLIHTDVEQVGYRHQLSLEEHIAYCARISNEDNRLNHATAPRLLKYLMEHKHWSPNEMVNLAYEIETSRAIGTQILRHRSFCFQELSQRYAEVGAIEPVELRMQAVENRQSSTDVVADEGEGLSYLYDKMRDHFSKGQELYAEMIEAGIAKECARMVLPLATQTRIIMNGSLRSWIHFLDLRCDEHAQKEVRLIAEAIRKDLAYHIPYTAVALGWVPKDFPETSIPF